MWKVQNTWKNAASPENQQRGMPAPGTGAQRTNPSRIRQDDTAVWVNILGQQGHDSWPTNLAYGPGNPSYPVDAQRGSPAPQGRAQAYRPGDLSQPTPDGRQYYRETREFSRGAQRWAPITGTVLNTPNPGSPVPFKPNIVPRYPLGQYINNTIFWANQVIPTSVRLQGLQTEKAVAAILSTFEVYGKAEVV